MLWPRVESQRYVLPLLVALVALAWAGLAVWGVSPYGAYLRHDELGEVDVSLSLGFLGVFGLFVAGWTVMTVAMMLPTALPLVHLFRRFVAGRANADGLVALVVVGYLLVWASFGALAHVADVGIHQAVERTPWLHANTWVIGAGVLLAAGVYQFTPLKYMCLDKCRSPYLFIAGRWRGRAPQRDALALGVAHGVFCVGCCWSLMLLMFGLGVGNLAWMLVLGIFMAAEKNLAWGKKLSAPVGAMLISAGVTVVVLQ